jgi:hypothetical protein
LERQINGFNEGDIRVVVLANKRHQIVRCPVKENKAYLTKRVFIGFTADDVGQVKVRSRRPPFRVDWFNGILWRQGMTNAIAWDPKPDEPQDTEVEIGKATSWGNKKDELPPLTMEENASFIDRLIAAGKAKDKKVIGGVELIVIMGMLGIIFVAVVLNLFGVHFGVSQIHTVVTTTATPTPTPIVLP